jgi:ubiquinone/menaquinone biosynthesis C-methylase UbiE
MSDSLPANDAEFDAYAEEYGAMLATAIAASGETAGYFADYKIRDLARTWMQHCGSRVSQPRVLDFGAGVGGAIPFFERHLPDAVLTCADASRRSLLVGQQRFAEHAKFVHCPDETLPLDSRSFDIAFAACVFHHIPQAHHMAVLRELRRVLRPGGMLMVYEHNPWNPLTVRTVRACPFDANAVLVSAGTMSGRLAEAGFARVRTRYRVFFPRALRALRFLESRLGWCPLGAQYHAVGVST